MKLFFTFLILILSATESFSFELENDKVNSSEFMVYDNTLILKSDYSASTVMKTFEEYDYTVESSPCNVLGDYYSKDDDSNTIYTIKIGDNKFQFMCRQLKNMSEEKRRLYLLGSTYDCISRPFDYSTSELDDFKYLSSLCDKKLKNVAKIDYNYLELFHPTKYYQTLASLVK